MKDSLLRETGSLCTICGREVAGRVLLRGGEAILEKECLDHGVTLTRLSPYGREYAELSRFYFTVMPESVPQRDYGLSLTYQCNMSCPICLEDLSERGGQEVGVEDVLRLVEERPDIRLSFTGGEPTEAERLSAIVKALSDRGKAVDIYTNGMRLSEWEYVRKLKWAGVAYVNLQFDGFDDEVNLELRGERCLKEKLHALDNLERARIPTGLAGIIVPRVNAKEIPNILDFAGKKEFIKDVTLSGLGKLGCARGFEDDDYLMPDELLAMVEGRLGGSLRARDMLRFQKIFYAILSAFSVRKCFYSRVFPLPRGRPLSESEFDRLEKIADRYRGIFGRSKLAARTYLLSRLVRSPLRRAFGNPSIRAMLTAMSYPKRMLGDSFLLILSTICDPRNFDARVADYCNQGYAAKYDGNIKLQDAIPLELNPRERLSHARGDAGGRSSSPGGSPSTGSRGRC